LKLLEYFDEKYMIMTQIPMYGCGDSVRLDSALELLVSGI